MKFETKKAANDYAKCQTQLTRREHKTVKTKGWFYDRETGEYYEKPCYTVILL